MMERKNVEFILDFHNAYTVPACAIIYIYMNGARQQQQQQRVTAITFKFFIEN